jgi:hypothetical protein
VFTVYVFVGPLGRHEQLSADGKQEAGMIACGHTTSTVVTDNWTYGRVLCARVTRRQPRRTDAPASVRTLVVVVIAWISVLLSVNDGTNPVDGCVLWIMCRGFAVIMR